MSRIARPLLLAALVAVAATALGPTPAGAASPAIVISQVYGGGGNAGATLRNDFVELFNRAAEAVDLGGWALQYASAAGTRWQATPLGGTLEPGGRFLVAEAGGGGGSEDLPVPDASGTIAMSATSGKVAVTTSTAPLACAASCSSAAGVVDFVGYGSAAAEHEGSGPAPTLTNSTAAHRVANGCVDTDDNRADFSTGAPDPRNRAATPTPCSGMADIGLEASDTRDPVDTGTNFRYVLTVENAGPATASDVMLTDTLPAGVLLEMVQPEQACSHSMGTVTCSLGSLEPGGSVSVVLFVDAVLGGDVTNTASATAAQLDATPPSAGETTTIEGPDCEVVGSPGPDVIAGTAGDDVICSLAGDDQVSAGAGDDLVEAGIGNDRVSGGPGNDTLEGWAGGDHLTGDGGADRLSGGEQGDVLEARDGAGGDAVDGGSATDKCRADGGDTLIECP